MSEKEKVIGTARGVVAGNGGHPGASWHWRVVALSVSAALLLAGFIGFLVMGRSADSACVHEKVNKTTLETAAHAIRRNDNKTLGAITDELKADACFSQNPTYLYIAVKYYSGINDVDAAGTYLTQFQKVYNPKQGLNKNLGANSGGISSLEHTVKAQQLVKNLANQNINVQFGD